MGKSFGNRWDWHRRSVVDAKGLWRQRWPLPATARTDPHARNYRARLLSRMLAAKPHIGILVGSELLTAALPRQAVQLKSIRRKTMTKPGIPTKLLAQIVVAACLVFLFGTCSVIAAEEHPVKVIVTAQDTAKFSGALNALRLTQGKLVGQTSTGKAILEVPGTIESLRTRLAGGAACQVPTGVLNELAADRLIVAFDGAASERTGIRTTRLETCGATRLRKWHSRFAASTPSLQRSHVQHASVAYTAADLQTRRT